jgi:hypothetical protein
MTWPIRAWAMTAVGTAVLSTTACVGLGPTSSPSVEDRFAALHARKLSAFDLRLAMERFHGDADAWTLVGQGWLELATCHPLEASVLDDLQFADQPLAQVVYASLLVEDLRRVRRMSRFLEDRRVSWNRQTIFEPMSREGFFNLDAAEIPEGYVIWLPAEETWADELPAPQPVEMSCDELAVRASSDSPLVWIEREFAALDRLLTLGATLPATERQGSVEALLWRARFHRASLATVLAVGAREEEPDVARQRMLEALDIISETHTDPPEPVQAEEAARALFLRAWLEAQLGHTEPAIASLLDAERRGLSEVHRWRVRYLRLRLLFRSGRTDEAIELSRVLPPKEADVYTAYLYHSAALKRLHGQEDRFLQLAMEAFRDRHYESDPFLRALYLDLLAVLSSYPFESRTIEVLEDMGPRHQTLERVEQFAHIALDRGQPENAAAAARWLLARQPVAREHPRFYAILALAAFLEDDVRAFDDSLRKITARPEHLLEVVPTHRQSSFFAHADTELARVLRMMLPVMAEWGESAQAHARRQRWLEIIVGRAQDFLRTTRESLARPALIELYRLASAMLADHPRGYAERVGQVAEVPLILGTVLLTGRDLLPYEPDILPSLRPPYSLTLLPRLNKSPDTWPFAWTDEVQP